MKRSLLFALLLALFMPWAANAQTTVTIGEGTATSNTNPIGTYYNYSITEQLYTADEIGMAGTISSISFYYMGIAAKDIPLAVYMANVDAEDLSTGISLADAEMVFSGTLPVTTTAGWVTINLDTPFAYDGTSSLLIGCIKDYLYYFSGQSWQGTATTTTMARYTQSDSAGPYTTSTVPSSTQANRPNIQMEITAGSGPTCARPTNFVVSYTGGSTATVTWEGEASLYNIDINGTVTEGVTSPYVMNVLPATAYTVKVQADCGDGLTSGWTGAQSFFTPCEAFDLPYAYGFEDANELNCWNMVYTANTPGIYNGSAYEGDNSFRFSSYSSASSYDQYLISPELNTTNGVDVTFYYTNSSSYGDETFKVGYSTTTNDPTAFTWGDEIVANELQWTLYEGSFPAGTKYVGVYYYSNYQYYLYVDDFTFEVPSSCRKPTNLTASEIGPRTAKLSWTENGEATAWNLLVNDQLIENVTNPYTLTGLTPETRYTVQVTPVCEVEKWSDAISFTTEVACPAPTALEVVPTPISATVTWTGDASNYILRYGTCAEPDPTQPATIIFHAGNVWDDGTGYQMLLDADATAYGTIIPATGALSTNCSGNEDIYAEFEYKIPANADGSCTTSNIVLDNTITLQIPAGTYDWCITNPTPGDRIWIASAQGNVGGRADDYVFEGGMIYEFNLYLSGSNDATDVTIMCSNVDWTYVNNATSPYTITGLDPETEYYVGVQAVCGGEDGESVWTTTSFTTPSNCDAPTALNVTNLMPTTATLNWTGYQDGYEVWYRPVAEGAELASIDFEDSSMGSWTTIDADGDGYDWVLGSACDGIYLNGGNLAGSGHNDSQDLVVSGSYSNVTGVGALTPDNYLVSPQVELGGSITFWAAAQDANYAAEVFGVAVSTTSNTDASAFTTIQSFTMTAKGRYINDGSCRTKPNNTRSALTRSGNRAAGTWYQYTVDLSDYAGQTGYVAIRHYDCTDQFMLDVDDITINGPATEEQEWIMASTDATSLDIEDLRPNTTYEWQVRGENRSCGEDGVTAWSEMGTFTTPNACDLPIDLVAEAEATSATLSWTGYQESYNVTYYTPATGNILIETGVGFNGYEDWTAVTEDEETNFYYLSSDYSYVGFGFSSTSTPQYLISPEFDALEGNSFVEFMYYATGTEEDELFPETFKIGYSTTDAEVASFTWGELYTVSDMDYMDVDLPAGTKYFAIQYESDHAADSTLLFFLDFTVVSNYSPAGTPTTLTNVTSPVTITGLTPETLYRWDLTGVSDECGELEAVYDYFTTPAQTNVTQTTELAKGWNWFSTYIVGRPTDLLQMLETSLGENGSVIKSKAISTDYYEDYGWYGDLDDEGLMSDQMYMIETSAACTVELEGMPINTAEVEITINHGWNWIGFPSAEPMNVVDAFAGFQAADGDILKNKAVSTDYYEDFGWYGELETMEPGQGFMYYSNSQETKTLVLGSKSKAIRSNVGNVLNLKKHLLKKLEIQKAKPIKK